MTVKAVRHLACAAADRDELLWSLLRSPHPDVPAFRCAWVQTAPVRGRWARLLPADGSQVLLHAGYEEMP
jgi:hypothetical protein